MHAWERWWVQHSPFHFGWYQILCFGTVKSLSSLSSPPPLFSSTPHFTDAILRFTVGTPPLRSDRSFDTPDSALTHGTRLRRQYVFRHRCVKGKMTRVCVVINDVGGIPHTLHENVLSNNASWSESSHLGIPLPSTDRAEGFKRVTRGTSSESVFSVATSRGITTVLAGPSCGLRRFPSEDAHTLFDPETTLAHMGVRRCSPYDDTCFCGRSDVYDDDTLRYATDAVRQHDGNEHLLLWVNLLALRDTDQIRTPSAIALSQPRWLDRRSHPESLHSIVSQVTDAVSRDFYQNDAPRSIPRHAETEFSNLLEHSVDTLERHLQRVRRFILYILERFPDASVCHTASHSLALGEHGMRGGRTPMSTTCTSFMSSRPSTSRCDNLDAVLFNFILDSLQLSHPPEVGQSVTRVPSLGLTRTLVLWNDHMYAVVEREGVIQNVFDLSTDPFELHDIVGNVSHISRPLQLAIRGETHGESREIPTPIRADEQPTTAQHPQQPQERPRPVSIPSPTASEVSTVTAPITISRQTSFSRRRTTATTTTTTNASQVSQNVRRAEQRLNKLHR